MAVAADLERLRQGTEIQSPLAVEELALARGLVMDAERRVLYSPRKKAMTVAPFAKSLFETEWRTRQEEEEQCCWRLEKWKEAADARHKKREDLGSKGSLRPRLTRAWIPVPSKERTEGLVALPDQGPTSGPGRDPTTSE